jgi:hypothetical protein
MFDDEELARTDIVGRIIHNTIASFAARGRAMPTPTELIAVATSRLAGVGLNEARAHRQNIAGAVAVYFRQLLPPAGWKFRGSEMHLGDGRVDLVWAGPGRRILLDEIKTGHPRQLETSRTRDQVHGYLATARGIWPDRLHGLRLLSTAEPGRSVFIDAHGFIRPLSAVTEVRSAA